jgi:hypothetical protein
MCAECEHPSGEEPEELRLGDTFAAGALREIDTVLARVGSRCSVV